MENLQNGCLAKDYVPGVLHNTSGHLVRQVVVQHPVVHALVVLQWARKDLIPGDGKLRATGRCDRVGDIAVAEQLFPGSSIVLFGIIGCVGWRSEGLDFIRAAGRGLAAEIHKALLLHKVALEGPH